MSVLIARAHNLAGKACIKCQSPDDVSWLLLDLTVTDGTQGKPLCGKCARALAPKNAQMRLKQLDQIMRREIRRGDADA